MQKVLDNLFQISPTLSPKLRNVAKLILDKPNAVATTSMRALAKQAGVTPPTMIRLARELGFENYEKFRQVFQTSVNDQGFGNRASWLQQSSETEGLPSIVHELAEASHRNIQSFYQNLDMDEVCNAADLIINAPTVYVVAAGGVHWIAAYLQYVGIMAVPHLRVPRNSGIGLIEGLIPIQKDDVVLTMAYSPYARQGIEATEYALSRGASLIYLTDSKAAPLASRAEALLLQKTASPLFYPSMVSVVSAIETLITVIVARSDEKVVKAISDHEKVRKNSIYLT
ncbi:MAG: MurR/RpiR family transcriptional regulator [Gammaproteobacteria bacterium]|nr:MurR/RpiR family transcriptional regulator [Gammaproteobacteria bacterium]